MPMLDQFHPCIHDSIENLVDVKADDNCGYRAIAILFGMGEDSWFLIRNHLLKELAKWFDEYINLLGGIDRPRIFFINGFLCFLEDEWQRNGEGRERGDATLRRR
ncbi:hypothetical protein GmHk_14G041003 [Glycine max]|nr:hypothetical protein GmHk_14G041003 [Glycine max]